MTHRHSARPVLSWAATAAAAVALLLTAAAFATPAAAADGTFIRLAQFSPDMPGAELVVSSVADPGRTIVVPGLGYGGLSDYRMIEPGDYVLALRPAGAGSAPLVSTTVDVMAGMAYTVAATGTSPTRGLDVIADDLTPPPAGQARLRVLDTGPPGRVPRVRDDRGTDVPVGVYVVVPAGPIGLHVDGAPDRTQLVLAANQIVSVVLVNRGGSVAAIPHVDAAGAATMPSGPVHAGLGGGTGHGSDTAVLGALAAVAALLAAVLAWRGRGGRRPGW